MSRPKQHFIISFFIALMLFLVIEGRVGAAPLQQDDRPQPLELTISWRPEESKVGQETLVLVTYTNISEEELPENQAFEITIQVLSAGTEEGRLVAHCEEPATGVRGLNPEQQQTHTCRLTVPQEGTFVVVAMITDETGQIIGEGQGDGQITVEPSSLPNELGRLFAGLGMFIAVMAIVAVGTEVVIDSAKVALGLKSKVTALEAFERMEQLMPGQLSALGVDQTSQETFNRLTKDLRATLAEVVKPAEDIHQLAEAIKEGQFGPIYQELNDLVSGIDQLTEANLLKLRQTAGQSLFIVDSIAQQLDLSPAFVAGLKQQIQTHIDQVDQESAVNFIDQLFKALQDETAQGQGWVEQITEQWLPGQLDLLKRQGSGAVLLAFEQQVKPVLVSIGFPAESIEAVRAQVGLALKSVDSQASQASEAYINSLRHLLDGVEERRFRTQSPWRKMWRRLRKADYGAALLIVVTSFSLGFFLWLFPPAPPTILSQNFLPWAARLIFAVSVGVIVALITTLLLFIFARLGQRAYDVYRLEQEGVRDTSLTTLERVEYFWNSMRGQKQSPAKWEQPEGVEKQVGTGLTQETAAHIVIIRSDQQRDEELSRLRWLRVLSALIGLVLAYLLQIDAAVLLETAVPGVAGTINQVFTISGERLNEVWPIFSVERDITAGIILTGLAASAGSTFWHDQLDRLQKAKEGAEASAEFIQQARQTLQEDR